VSVGGQSAAPPSCLERLRGAGAGARITTPGRTATTVQPPNGTGRESPFGSFQRRWRGPRTDHHGLRRAHAPIVHPRRSDPESAAKDQPEDRSRPGSGTFRRVRAWLVRNQRAWPAGGRLSGIFFRTGAIARPCAIDATGSREAGRQKPPRGMLSASKAPIRLNFAKPACSPSELLTVYAFVTDQSTEK
jgi:hypothetical protein